jgi:hypothetical protein
VNYGWVLIPFYSDPNASEYSHSVEHLKLLATEARRSSGLRVAVVDDGSHLRPEDFAGLADIVDQAPSQTGKAAAIRRGLHAILTSDRAQPFAIVQFDGDADQSANDVGRLLRELEERTKNDWRVPALVIGERYHGRMNPPARPESIPYRQALIIFLSLIARRLGFTVGDWVSGARAYTSQFAHQFVEASGADGYGVEAEQLVIARIEQAIVGGVPLSYGRPRDPKTKAAKWLQTLSVFDLHAEQLERAGLTDLLGVVSCLSGQISAGIGEFDIDLTPLGESSSIHFQRQGLDYTASVTIETRLSHFERSDSFAIRSGSERAKA